MNAFLELLNEAKDEVIQEAWDRVLIKSFRTWKYPATGFVVDRFKDDYKLSSEQFYALKRVPRFPRQFKTRVPRFIAAYLPSLNDKLYESKMSEDQLVLWMKRVNLDTENKPSDYAQSVADGHARKRVHKQLEANRLSAVVAAKRNDMFGRSWTTTKAVRSK